MRVEDGVKIQPAGPSGIPPERPSGPSLQSRARPATDRVGDRAEVREAGTARLEDDRKVRLEALREALVQGRYHLTDDAIARAILRTAMRNRHDRSV